MLDEDKLYELIRAKLPDACITIHDLTGGKDHYEVEVVSKAFEGLSLLAQQRLVNDALKGVLGGAVHALTLKTRIPAGDNL